jgi:L-methionine (R)-S-oxide reductase
MPIVMKNVLDQIRTATGGTDDRVVKAKRLADLIRTMGDYRWVGIYDVGRAVVSILGYSGPGAPEFATFAVNKGLTGAAIKDKKAVIVGDVRKDKRYLTAFGNTLSEMIVPVIDPSGERVIGTIDVESEQANAFGPEDQRMIEQCAQAALPLWLLR